MPVKDFLSIRDCTSQQMRHYLHVATQVKAYPNVYHTALKGKTLAMIFEKPSLRTRVTFDVGHGVSARAIPQGGTFSRRQHGPES